MGRALAIALQFLMEIPDLLLGNYKLTSRNEVVMHWIHTIMRRKVKATAVGVGVVLAVFLGWCTLTKTDHALTTVPFISRLVQPYLSHQFGWIGVVNGTDPKMHCCRIASRLSLERTCRVDGGIIQSSAIAKRAMDEGCTCVDLFYCKLVVVTATSSNHYTELQDLIGSVQKFLPRTNLIVYDLGMTEEQKNQLQTFCNIEIRPFVFEKYPPHTKRLRTFAWKVFAVEEVVRDYEVIMWADSSVRLTGPLFAETIFPLLLQFPFMAPVTRSYLPIVSFTHDRMLQYLNLSLSRKQMAHFGHVEATCWVMWANSLMREKFLNHWLDCAMHQECITPDGARVTGCNYTTAHENAGGYTGCHRYDQSALCMILIREFGLEVWNSVVHVAEAKTVFHVQKRNTYLYTVRVC